MSRGRLAACCLALGAIASQAGHLLVYQLRFGAAAQQVQSSGAHAYFPVLARTVLGFTAVFLLLSLLLVGLARLVSGRRLDGGQAPSYLRLVATLFWIQLACFALQETLEGAAGASPAAFLLWGTAGQLPIALLGALALRWLAVRLGPAVSRLRARPAPALRPLPAAISVAAWRPAAVVAVAAGHLTADTTRRGPPFRR